MKDLIEKRLNLLRQQREQLVTNLHAVSGAIAVLEDMLKPQPEKKDTDERIPDKEE